MPDRRQHRGAHPDDPGLFAPSVVPRLRIAVAELSWLLTRGYVIDSSIKLVGDRHDLTVRQRMAVRRAACSDEQLECRIRGQMGLERIAGAPLGIDGYNVLITVESALSGGAIFIGRDGCFRDLASVHSTYRKVSETGPALDLIFEALARLRPARIEWLLDRPVSNSGRLRAFMTAQLQSHHAVSFLSPVFSVQTVDSPDAVLRTFDGVVATSDSAILDRCSGWTNLAVYIVESYIPHAWKVDLRRPEDPLET